MDDPARRYLLVDEKTVTDDAPWTLNEGDIKDEPRADRRTALAAIGAAVLGALGAVVVPSEALAQGCTDRDSGPGQDSAGHGRFCGGGSRGCTDSDSGQGADGAGQGRHCGGGGRTARGGCTDSDAGAGADGVGQGRHCGGRRTPAPRREPQPLPQPVAPTPVAPTQVCSDSDDGPSADHVGHGRTCR